MCAARRWPGSMSDCLISPPVPIRPAAMIRPAILLDSTRLDRRCTRLLQPAHRWLLRCLVMLLLRLSAVVIRPLAAPHCIAALSRSPHRRRRPQIISKRRKFVADGVFFAELSEFFTRELANEGYSGCEVRVTHARTEVIIRATHTQEVLGEKGRRIRELTSLVQKRFKFAEGSIELYAEKVRNRGLSAIAQCESLKYKLLGGLAVRRWVPIAGTGGRCFLPHTNADVLLSHPCRAAYGVLRFVMESGAKGCEVVISGKLRAARAKAMKFTDGFMIQ